MTRNLVYGMHASRWLMTEQPGRVIQAWVQTTRRDVVRDWALTAGLDDLSVHEVSVSELDELLGEYGVGLNHQGVVLAVRPLPVFDESALLELIDNSDDVPLLLALDEVQDPHNLGACLRTADAMGVTAVVVPKRRAVGLTPAVRKVACGAAETVPLAQVTNLARCLDQLRKRNIWIFGADADERDEVSARYQQSLYEADLTGAICWVFGSEGSGLRRLTREKCDYLVSIPMLGAMESLNVSVSVGICLAETVRQRA